MPEIIWRRLLSNNVGKRIFVGLGKVAFSIVVTSFGGKSLSSEHLKSPMIATNTASNAATDMLMRSFSLSFMFWSF